MKLNPTLKKILKITGIVFLVLLLINVIAVFVVRAYLPAIIEKNNDSAYNLEYSEIGFSIFNGSFKLKDVKLVPKADASIEKDIDLLGTVKEIQVTGVNFITLFTKQNLDASTIYIEKPDLQILKPAEKKTKKSEPKKFTSKIDINKISVQRANISYLSTDGQQKLQQVFNLNLIVKGIHMGEYTVGKNIPFTYKDYNISMDSVYSNLNDIEHIKTGEIVLNNEDFFMSDFRIQPEVSKKEFQKNTFNTDTRIDLKVPKLHLKETDWGYDNTNEFYVKVGGIYIDSIRLQILDQKEQTVFQEAKMGTSNIIQPLIPFPIEIGELDVKKAAFNSTEVLDLKKVHINIKNISNKIHEKLIVDKVSLLDATIQHNVKTKKNKPNQNPEYKSTTQLNDEVVIKDFEIKNAEYTMYDAVLKRRILSVKDFNLTFKDIIVNDSTVKQKAPFDFKKSYLKTGKLHYDTGDFYDIYSNGVTFNNQDLVLSNLEMKSKFSRKVHVSKFKWATDIYDIKTGKIICKGVDWLFDSTDTFNLQINNVELNSIFCNIYRSTLPPTEMIENHMYNKKLREIPIGLAINTITIKNSHLEYEEVDANSISPGKLTFANFNAQIENVFSGKSVKKLPQTVANVQTKFMNTSNLNATWRFNIMDVNDSFTINGTILNFPAKGMNPFIKPYIKVGVDGMLNKVYFSFKGNKNKANGTFGMNYSDLKVTLFKDDGKESKKVMSAITNLLLKSDTKNQNKEVQIWDVERKKECSFFNYLWLCVLQGLKQTLVSNTIKI